LFSSGAVIMTKSYQTMWTIANVILYRPFSRMITSFIMREMRVRRRAMANGRNKYQSRENRAKVREVLMREWDPIGVREFPEAQEEYDTYVGKVYVMLMDDRASASQIAEYLFEVATVRMGLSKESIEHQAAMRTAEVLIALRPSFELH
jgi:hypothetical protein